MPSRRTALARLGIIPSFTFYHICLEGRDYKMMAVWNFLTQFTVFAVFLPSLTLHFFPVPLSTFW